MSNVMQRGLQRQLSFYKGVTGKWGALQFNLQRPHFYCGNCKKRSSQHDFRCGCPDPDPLTREGCVFVEITSTKSAGVYDWDNKIVMALSVHDLGKILLALQDGSDLSLYHDPHMKSSQAGQIKKGLSFSFPKGKESGCMVSANETKAGATTKHTVPLNAAEALTLKILLERAVCATLDW